MGEVLPSQITSLMCTSGQLTLLQNMCTAVQTDTGVSVTQIAALSPVDTYHRVQPVLPAVLVCVEGSIDVEPLIHIPQDHMIPLLLEVHYEAQSWETAIQHGYVYALSVQRHVEYQERSGTYTACGVYRLDVESVSVVEWDQPGTYVAQVRVTAVARSYRRIRGVIL